MGSSLFDLAPEPPRDVETFDLFGAPPPVAPPAPVPEAVPPDAETIDLFGALLPTATPRVAAAPTIPPAPSEAAAAPDRPERPPVVTAVTVPRAPEPLWVTLARDVTVGAGGAGEWSRRAVTNWRDEGLALLPALEGDTPPEALAPRVHLAFIEAGVRLGGMATGDVAAVDVAVAEMAAHHAGRAAGQYVRQAEGGDPQATNALWFVVQRSYEERTDLAARGARHAIYADAFLNTAVEKAAAVLLPEKWPTIQAKAREVAAKRPDVADVLAVARAQAGKALARPECALHDGVFTGDPDTLLAQVGYAASLHRLAHCAARAQGVTLDRAGLMLYAANEGTAAKGRSGAARDAGADAAVIPASAPAEVSGAPTLEEHPAAAASPIPPPMPRARVEDATPTDPAPTPAASWRAGLRRGAGSPSDAG